MCAAGSEPRAFTYVLVELEDGQVVVWEIPERLRSIAHTIDDAAADGDATVLNLRKDGTAVNSPIVAVAIGFEAIRMLDVEPFVATLGWRGSRPRVARDDEQRRNA